MKSVSCKNLVLFIIVMLWRRVRRRYGISWKNGPRSKRSQQKGLFYLLETIVLRLLARVVTSLHYRKDSPCFADVLL